LLLLLDVPITFQLEKRDSLYERLKAAVAVANVFMVFFFHTGIVSYQVLIADCPCPCPLYQELEEKRKEKAKVAYERKKQLAKLRVKAEKAAEEKLGSQLEILAPIKY
jgi:hypothetical protein